MDEKIKKILEEAEKVFHKYGIRSVSMDDICKELGISKKTIYRYFKNKEDVVNQVVDEDIKRHTSHVQNFMKKKFNAIDELFEISKIICTRLKEINPAFSFDLNKYYPELFNRQIEYKRDLIHKSIKKNIRHGIKEGFYREDLNVELVARLYIQKLEFVHDPACYSSKDISFSRVFKVMFENHIRGISNQKGIKYLEQKKKSLNFKC